MTNAMVIKAASEELAAVIGALLDAPGLAEASFSPVDVRWAVALAFSGPSDGTVVFGFDADGAQALAKLVMALDEEPQESAVSDTLLEVCGQALSAVSQRAGFEGLRLVKAKIVPTPTVKEPKNILVAAGDRFATAIACWATVETADAGGSRPSAASELAALVPGTATPANLELILDIDLPLTVRFGETELSLLSLTRLAPGSIIDLGRSPEDPVDVLVNGRLIARGEVVVVAGNYGVRIVEVISPADRLSTVAA